MPVSASFHAVSIALDLVIAWTAALTALDLARRSAPAGAGTAFARLAIAALALGGGAWAVHVVAMLAAAPEESAAVSAPRLGPLLVAVLASGIGLWVAARPASGQALRDRAVTAAAAMIIGLGLFGLHELGLAAARPGIYAAQNPLFALAAAVAAVAAAWAALALAMPAETGRARALGAGILALALVALGPIVAAGTGAEPVETGPAGSEGVVLVLGVAGAAILVLILALAAALIDGRLDVAAAKRRHALAESEERFRLLVQGVTDYAIFMLDTSGVVTNWNSGAERIKGYRAEEIVGQHFSVFYSDADRAAGVPQKALATAEREGRYEAEGWRRRKDGSLFWAMVVLDSIRDDSGRLIGYGKVTRDMTERREAQRKLDETRQQLHQAQKMEMVGQLTGGVAHDFNNLLAVVIGNLELLRKRIPDDPKIVRLVDAAMKGAERGAALTQRMLAFARRQDLNPVATDVAALVHGMADLLQRSLLPTVSIETRFPLFLPPAHVDANQLELALVNLAVNARDAMPDGGAVTIGASEETVATAEPAGLVPGRYIRLYVADTGTGMDADTLERAMEPFFTTKGVGKGTGLGLSMVHGLAAQSGGKFVLSSELGRGTKAEIWLPVDEAAAKARQNAPHAQPAPPRPREAEHLPASLRVLAVDDDVLVLTATAAMLEDLGFEVVEALSAHDALERLRADGRFDLVLTDEAMPGMTGTQLAEQVRAGWPGLPILLGTGYAELPRGVDPDLPRITKPFDQAALARAIRRVIPAGTAEAEPGSNVVQLKIHP